LKARLERLYDALDTGKLSLDELAPRMKELRLVRTKHSGCECCKKQEMTAQGFKLIDATRAKEYAHDLLAILT